MAAEKRKGKQRKGSKQKGQNKKEIIEGVYFQNTRPTVAHLAVCLPRSGQGRVQLHLCTGQGAPAGSVNNISYYFDPRFIKHGSQDPRGM